MPLTGGATGLVCAGGFAYLCCAVDGLRIVDVSVPEVPALIGTADTPGEALDVAVVGSYAYVADGYLSGLLVIDVADPAHPQIVRTLAMLHESYGCSSVAAVDDVVYAMAYWGYEQGPPGWYWESHLKVVDTAVPPSATWTTAMQWVEWPGRQVIDSGGHLAQYGSSRLTLLDTAGGGVAPGYDGYTATAQIADIDIADGKILLVDDGGTASLYDPFVTVPATAFQAALPGTGLLALAADGDLVVQLLQRSDGGGTLQSFEVWLVQNPAAPTLLRRSESYVDEYSGGFGYPKVWGRIVATMSWAMAYGGPQSLSDYTVPSAPLSGTLPDWGDRLAYAEGRAYLHSPSTSRAGAQASPSIIEDYLYIYDVDPVTTPVRLSETILPFWPDAMHAVGDQLYLLKDGLLYRVDASNPADPLPPVPVPLPGTVSAFACQDGGRLYLSQGATIHVLRVTDPEAPVLLATHTLVRGQAPIEVHAGILYAGGTALHAYTHPTPGVLTYLSGCYDYGAGALGFAGGRLYSKSNGTRAVLPHCADLSAVETGPRELPAGRLLAIQPNPFNPTCSVRFALRAPGPVRLRAYDLKGRRVATIVEGAYPAGPHEVVWRGVDDHGRPLGSGVYLLRLEAAGRVETAKAAIVR